ncbi:hypothetical protein C2G38_2084228 [Gigaspora rosea]|uniref:Uncharacterized protein n=1 Tax=Gigaspora rosea TaxID=44941 RepID=A0A397V8W2_9GLOM|nr:hypothetical protein C2G38_2084228 [Gigaspora rosea]
MCICVCIFFVHIRVNIRVNIRANYSCANNDNYKNFFYLKRFYGVYAYVQCYLEFGT